jgi:hypothetical protein
MNWTHAHRRTLEGVYSPLFSKDESTNNRAPLTQDDLQLPGNETMAHTAEQKFRRIAALRDKGKRATGK